MKDAKVDPEAMTEMSYGSTFVDGQQYTEEAGDYYEGDEQVCGRVDPPSHSGCWGCMHWRF